VVLSWDTKLLATPQVLCYRKYC